MTRTLVFDAYGTLYDVQSVLAKAEAMCPGKGEVITQVWRLKQLEYTWLRSLMQKYEDFWEMTIAGARDLPPPSDRRRLSPKLLCLNLLRELRALLRTELFCPRALAPLIGRAECPRRFLILRSILLQSTITGHPDLLLQQPQFGLPCVGTT